MCQVILIIAIDYIQIHVNILFLFKWNGEVKLIISGCKLQLRMLPVKICWKVSSLSERQNTCVVPCSTCFLLCNSIQPTGSAVAFQSVTWICSTRALLLGEGKCDLPLKINLSFKETCSRATWVSHARREAEKDPTLPLCHQAFPNVLCAVSAQPILRKAWEH